MLNGFANSIIYGVKKSANIGKGTMVGLADGVLVSYIWMIDSPISFMLNEEISLKDRANSIPLIILLTAFISPYRADRLQARTLIDPDRFVEIFVDVPLETAEKRDPKGLYAKARRGEIPDFTGISAPYEKPQTPEIHLHTGDWSAERCLAEILAYLQTTGIIPPRQDD